MALRIRLLGAVEVTHDGEAIRFDSSRVESLLAYLLLHRDAPQSRPQLAYLLWPDTSDAQARTNLRHVLHKLRRALPDSEHYLDVTARTLQWRPASDCEIDVADFLATCDAAQSNPTNGIEALRRAAALYHGELVPGCYDDWLLAERESFQQRYLAALRRLARLLEANGEAAQAISCTEQILATDPLDEMSYRTLMRLYDARGDRARALRVFHTCTSALERELGVAPSAATTELYRRLLHRQPAATSRRQQNQSEPKPQTEPNSQPQPLGASPFVGRARERGTLAALWRATEAGQASLVLVTGEPGIGKTRLVEDFRAWCAHRGAATGHARSYAAEGELAYGPVVTWLRSPAVHGGVPRLGRDRLTELARLLPELLVEIPGLPRPEPLPESELRHRMSNAAAQALRQTGRSLLLIADDLQWADRETLQFLHYLLRVFRTEADPADGAAGRGLLVVATVRSGELDPGSPLAELVRAVRTLDSLTEIDLEPLSHADTAVLAARLTGAALDASSARRLWRETEGNPLFVVESLRAGRPGTPGVSPKVQAVIESRLAELSPAARDLIGVAATIGRDFTVELLAQCSDVDEDAVVSSLDELWRRRLAREQGGNTYDFTHDQIRAVAYDGVGPVRRRHHHLRIARALEMASSTAPGPVSAQIAAHYEQAGATNAAADWYLRAAAAAQRLQANAEAIRLLERSRNLLTALPASRERDLRELAVLTALPAPLASVEGYASPRLSAVHDRALQLVAGSGSALSPPLLWSLAFTSLVHDDYVRAERFAGELRARGEHDADQILVVQGLALLGVAAFWQAELEVARTHLEQAINRYRPEQRIEHLLRYGQDPEVLALARLGNIAWLQGDPDRAVRARDAAMVRAQEIDHPLTTAAALIFAALLALDMADTALLREYSRTLTTQHLSAWPIRLVGKALAGYVDVLDGRTASGVRQIESAIDESDPQPSAPGMRAILVRILLAACVSAGDARTGIAAAERLLAMAGPGRVWVAEARRQHARMSGPSPALSPGNG